MSGRLNSQLRWIRPIAFALPLFLGMLTTAQAGPTFVYNFANHDALQNGWTVTGTITTDTDSGIIGIGGSASITAWSITLTPTSGTPLHFDSTEPSSFLQTGGRINITPSQITMYEDPGNILNQLTFIGAPKSGMLHYQRSSVTNSLYYAYERNDVLAWVGLNPVAADMGGDPWVIATSPVPEPSTLVGGCLAGVVLLVMGRRRLKSRVD